MNNNYPVHIGVPPVQGNDILNALDNVHHVIDMFDPWAAGDFLRPTPTTAAGPGAMIPGLGVAGVQHQGAVPVAGAAVMAAARTRHHRERCPICRMYRFFATNRWDMLEFGCGLIVGVGFIGFSFVTLDWLLRNASADGRIGRTAIVAALPVRTSIATRSLPLPSVTNCLLGLPVGN